MNRIESRPSEQDDSRAGDYFAVAGEEFVYTVSGEMVRFIESVLDRWPRPTWIIFVDRHGSRIRIRSRLIQAITQCTAEQRAVERAFYRDLRQERKDGGTWDD
jgi:hypothetical protein